MKTEADNKSLQTGAWVLYILECGDKTLYTGITTNLTSRIKAHNKGTAARYTRAHLPVKLAYTETCASHSLALQREYAVKQLKRSEKLSLINNSRKRTRKK